MVSAAALKGLAKPGMDESWSRGPGKTIQWASGPQRLSAASGLWSLEAAWPFNEGFPRTYL